MSDTETEVVAAHRDPVVIDASMRALTSLRELLPSLVGALLLTDDGFEIARTAQHGGTDERLASMASSLQALGEAIARELGLGDSEYALIEAHHGRVLLRRIPVRQIILAGVFDDDETVGTALAMSRKVADELSAELGSAR